MDLEQDRLRIREAQAEDAELLCRWWNDGTVMAHAGFPNGLGTTPEKIRAELKTDQKNHRLIIEIDGVAAGEMSYREKDGKTAEIGIKICDAAKQEKGYGTRLLRLFLNALFQNAGFDKVVLDTNLNNTRAQHVYEKLGFQKLRVNRDSWNDQLGHPQSSVDYLLKKEQWNTNNE